MVRKVLYGVAVLAVSFGVAFAEEFPAIIKKVDDGKVTFAKFNRKEKKISDDTTLPAAQDIKVVKAKFNKETKSIEAGEDLPGGLKNERFKEIRKGVFALIVTDADGKNITQLRVFPEFKKKKKKDSN